MIKGLYTSASAMGAQKIMMEKSANNTANISTPGFKKELLAFAPLEENRIVRRDSAGGRDAYLGISQSGVTVAEISRNWQSGVVVQTGVPTQLALAGKGFFELEVRGDNPGSERAYTRNGHFRLSPEGYLETAEGHRLMGEAGPIRVSGEGFIVSGDGSIPEEGGGGNKIRVVSIADVGLLKNIEGGHFTLPPGVEAITEPEPRVLQGSLEKSNVNIIEEIVDILSVTRNYQMNQKVMQTIDEITSKTVNEVGSLK